MNKTRRYLDAAFIIVAVLLCGLNLSGGVLLPGFFSDNMVLQRGVEVAIFGDGTAGEKVTVKFNGQECSALADKKTGKWMVKLAPMKAEFTPRPMIIATKSGNLTIKNVLVGDVWFCAGEEAGWSTLGSMPSAGAIMLKGENAGVRVFETAPAVSGSPQSPMLLTGVWRTTGSKDASKISAVAYLFAKFLRDKLNVPIGVVNAKFAGSSIQSWIGLESYKETPLGKALLARWNKKAFSYHSNVARWRKACEEWQKRKNDGRSKRRRKPKEPLGNPASPLRPAGINNNVVAPFKNVRIRGFVWSQGAADATRAKTYSAALELFLKSFRVFWGDAKLPIVCELPAPTGRRQRRVVEFRQIVDSLRGKLEEAASQDTSLRLVSSQDLGWANNLPRFDLARRLALTAAAAMAGKEVSPTPTELVGGDKEVRIIFAGAESGLVGREIHRFVGDHSSLVGKTVKIKRKRKKKRITPIASEKGERLVVKAVVELRGAKGGVIKTLKTIWDEKQPDPVRDFREAETKLTPDEKKMLIDKNAKLAEERKKKSEEMKKREEADREPPRKNPPASPPLPRNTEPLGLEPSMTPAKSSPAMPPAIPTKTPPTSKPSPQKGIVKTTLYMLNSKKLRGFAASREKAPISWVVAKIEGNTVVIPSKAWDPVERVRYGCADNPIASLWNRDGLPALPFDRKVKSVKSGN